MTIFKKIFRRQQAEPVSFKDKLHHFQLLLFSNDEALKLMGGLSDIIVSGKPFSRGEIYPVYSDILKNTKEVTEHLSIMCGGRYKTLISHVRRIKDECERQLSPAPFCPERWDCEKPDCSKCEESILPSPDLPYFYRVDEITFNHTREVGAKMSRLCEVHNRLNVPIPDGFCLTSRCFDDFFSQGDLYPTIEEAISSIDFNDNSKVQQASRVIQALIISSPIPQIIEKTTLDEYDNLARRRGNVLVSVRSSAVGEDDLHFSFAGLHYTALNVSRANLVDACFEVLISKYLPQSLVYRYMTGLRDADMPMSIGCLQMIDSEVSGVLFTRDPLRNRDEIIIQAVRGLGTKVVDGSVEAQEYIVEHSDSLRVLSFKPGNQEFRAAPRSTDGLYDEKVPDDLKRSPCLDHDQIRTIVEYALKIEQYYESPQDIEWAIDKKGEVYILQCRPLAISDAPAVGTGSEPQSGKSDAELPVLMEGGACASPGICSGKVFLLNRSKDIVNFPSGGILVVKKTSPELTRVLHKASGLIADIGNTTGHLAIIARELKIPVLVNTGDATTRLKDEMSVTLDATAKRVYLGIGAGSVQRTDDISATKNVFMKSPMYRIWNSVSQSIIPLNLTDPDASDFSPDNCRTLHDVTRFAHEYSMREMFSLYESAEHEDKKAYPLKFPVPLDVYVIDLGNGLCKIEGRRAITPDDILSKPFLSLISGMTAPGVRWAGPLPIDLKGFTSLMMSNIVDAGRGDRALGGRSYAIISDYYLNFSSRLGYHFSRLDAYACDEINNNYINFDFRGGAADPLRRVRRAKVVARILELSNFSVAVQNDNVLATIRKVPVSDIIELLNEIGRLMGAVRNAD
ncbi:MAG TPA: PEP/pyruvate-binding domain-containing protein, partial [Candidatus Kryptobacter bacterium]|nr:PEP/pyruvate-binding domain-containing protein [Candidatus Kryptobacter bacterium]